MGIFKNLGKYFCLSSVLFLSSTGHAVRLEIARGFVMMGFGNMNFSELNTTLKKLDYSRKLSNPVALVGLGGYGVLENNIVIGAHGYLIRTHSISSETQLVTLIGGTHFFDMGYRFKFKNLNIYPLFGIGKGGMRLRVDPRDVEFNDYLKGTTKQFSTEIGLSVVMIDISLGLEFFHPNDHDTETGSTLGLRMGYVHAFDRKNDWETGYSGSGDYFQGYSGYADVLNGPAFSLSHFYITFTGTAGYRIQSPTPVATEN